MDLDFFNTTVIEMKNYLRLYDLPVSGNKSVLFERIKELKKAIEKYDELMKTPKVSSLVKTDVKRNYASMSSSSSTSAKTSPEPAKKLAKHIIQLGIVPSHLEADPLSRRETDLIKEAVIDVVINLSDEDGARPNFTETIEKLGWIIFYCSNSATADWMHRNFEKIKLKCKLDIALVEKDAFPIAFYVCGLFPESFELTNEKILATINGQNDYLFAKGWNVFRRDKEGDLLHLAFFMNVISVVNLRTAINYRFGEVHIRCIQLEDFSGFHSQGAIDGFENQPTWSFVTSKCNLGEHYPRLKTSECLSCSKLFETPATKDNSNF